MSDAALARFAEPTRAWFASTFDAATTAQRAAWTSLATGASTLVLAPTGSGKTLAAFLASIDRLMFGPMAPPKERCRVIYVSPLKALAVDVERNLRAPIAGIAAAAERLGVAHHALDVAIRTGDTPSQERARIQRHPPDVLITTPESLYLMTTTAARALLIGADVLIIDEIHALLPTKRGAHLALTLERIEALRATARPNAAPLQRIGLSATQRTLDEVSRFLGGFDLDAARGAVARPVTIVDARTSRSLEIRVESAVDDMSRIGTVEDESDFRSGPATAGPKRTSIWPHLHPYLLALIRQNRSTIVFVNSRRLGERLANALNELAAEEGDADDEGVALEPIAEAHHGSVAREKRAAMEDRLKRGELPAIVATSSLELGIDMAAVDLVVQIESPPTVTSTLQRIGRARHQVGEVPRGILLPKHRSDLLACAAIVQQTLAGEVEPTRYPRLPLDVLTQQIVAIVSGERGDTDAPVDDVFDLVRRAAPFAELSRRSFEAVLDMLSGRYPSDAFAELRPRLVWDRIAGTVRARAGAFKLALLNAGTIAERGLYGVFLGRPTTPGVSSPKSPARRVGELDEEMVFESRIGEVFMLGASSWRIEDITRDQVIVSPAPGEPGKMPFWHGDRPGRSVSLGRAIGALGRELGALIEKKDLAAADAIAQGRCGFDARASKNLLAWIGDQLEAGALPTDRTIVIERSIDELGDHRVCILSPFGGRVHAPWSTAIASTLREGGLQEVDAIWSDDGMVFRLPSADRPPDPALFLIASNEIEARVIASLSGTSQFSARFRECAGRALLLPRKAPGRRTPLWAQRKRAADLLTVAADHPDFPILVETYRECLRDVFDLPALIELLAAIEQRRIEIVTVDARTPSPFASSLMFSYVGNFMYEGDAPLAERRAQLLTVDAAQLRELLGETDLRQLLDADAIDSVEAQLQRTDPSMRARSIDEVHDLLRTLGDLSRPELAIRVVDALDLDDTIATLVRRSRAVEVKIAGETRLIAIEDAARCRDGLGAMLPRGVPAIFLEPQRDALRSLVARYARTHVPFAARDLARRFGVGNAAIEAHLDALEAAGSLTSGEMLADGHGREHCDVEILRRLRRASLAKLRAEVEPVDAATYARFLIEWHELRASSESPVNRVDSRTNEQLLRAIERLQGAPIPASALEHEILPSRVPGYRPAMLDALSAAGEIVWAGVEPIGPNDGRVALYLADHELVLASSMAGTVDVEPLAETSLAARVRGLLEARGALFFHEIVRAIGGFPTDLVEAIWLLVWRGELTNDTLAPLRQRLTVAATATRSGRRRREPATSGRLTAPPGTTGRWSLRRRKWLDSSLPAPTDTQHRTALAQTLLDRHGVLTREAVRSEGVVGGFGAVYDVLRAMEESGRARRGYFVAGCGGAQFSRPGADDRLRACRTPSRDDDHPRTWILSASDPANPYGAALPWPSTRSTTDTFRPQRAAGALVVLHDGAPVGWLARNENRLITFAIGDEGADEAATRALAAALATLVDDERRRLLLITTIDGFAIDGANESPLIRALISEGFTSGARGLLRKSRRPT